MAMLPKALLAAVLVSLVSGAEDAPAKAPRAYRGSVKYGTVYGTQKPQPFQRKSSSEVSSPPVYAEEDLSLEDTVSEVEKYLRSQPGLPDLSREEIINYINNISESEKKDPNPEMKKTGAENEPQGTGPVVVVLPFKPEKEEDIEEIYTRSPMVQYLEAGEELTEPQEESPQGTTERVYPVYETTTEDIITTTDGTVRSYTNYNDAEMVTKKYVFEETRHGSNHKYEESELERVKSPIIVLPEKIHTKNTPKPFFKDDHEHSLEDFGFGDLTTTTTTATTTTTTKKPLKKRVKKRRKTTTTTTTEATPDLNKVLEILPPDMKDLLESLALGKERLVADAPTGTKSSLIQPTIDPSSYSAFKPLPTGRKNAVDDGMKDFLASFGLVQDEEVKSRRREKALEPPKYIEEVPDVSLEIIPEDMRHVLLNLGLTREAKESRNHIFNPSNHVNQSREEAEKLKALMSSIKKIVSMNESEEVSPELQKEIIQQIQDLDNLTLKYKNKKSTLINDEIKQIIITNKNKFNFFPLDNITGEGEGFAHGPDPLDGDGGDIKNEVKRQVSFSSSSSSSSSSSDGTSSSSSSSSSSDGTSSSSSSSSSSGSDSSSSDTTTTEEPPNIEGLRASFGGGETAPDDADIDSKLPPKKPNGLYLLVDWNSFLEVGTDDDKRRVNIRFQPKIGDGRHFIPVTVP